MQEKELTVANGYTYRVQVNDQDAERYGLKPRKKSAENKRGPEPENKKDDEDSSPSRPGAARRRGK